MTTKSCFIVGGYLLGVFPGYYLIKWFDRWITPAGEKCMNRRSRVLKTVLWPLSLSFIALAAVLTPMLLAATILLGIVERLEKLRPFCVIGEWFDRGPA